MEEPISFKNCSNRGSQTSELEERDPTEVTWTLNFGGEDKESNGNKSISILFGIGLIPSVKKNFAIRDLHYLLWDFSATLKVSDKSYRISSIVILPCRLTGLFCS